MNLSKLEPFGIFALAGGLLYSICVLVVHEQETHFKFHFTVLTLVIFLALMAITSFKYLKYRYQCEKMEDIMSALKLQ